MYNEKVKAIFEEFYDRPDTFSLGICNGCQLFGLLGWVPWRGIAPKDQPRFVHNDSGKFESRWSTVTIEKSQSIMLKDMEGLTFGINVAHGEGKLHFPHHDMINDLKVKKLLPIVYVDDAGWATEEYPFNPNGSPEGLAGMCSEDGRHLAMMPHPERTFLPWQCHYLPEGMKQEHYQIGVSPWMRMFQNAYKWCAKN
jgi:phosphoribosylformylglycinamidine synthase